MSNGIIKRNLEDGLLAEYADGKELALYISLFYTNVLGMDYSSRYMFANCSTSFNSTDSYLLSRVHYDKYLSYAINHSQEKYLVDMKDRGWTGSGTGMAVTSVLDKEGKIAFNEGVTINTDGAKSMNAVFPPKNTEAISSLCTTDAISGETITLAESATNYYQLVAKALPIHDDSYNSYTPFKETLKSIVDKHSCGGVSLLCYTAYDTSIHAEVGATVVLTGRSVLVDGNYEIEIFNFTDQGDIKLVISSDFKKCTIANNGRITTPLRISCRDTSQWDVFDIDGEDNSAMNISSTTGSKKVFESVGDDTWIYVDCHEEFSTQNAEGEFLEYTHSELRGDMEILSECYIDNGLDKAETVAVKVSGSNSYTFATNANEASFYVVGGGRYAGATGTGIEKIVLLPRILLFPAIP